MQLANATAPMLVPPRGAILGFFAEYLFLSSYYKAAVFLDGLRYPSAEHAYVAQKSAGLKMRAFIASLPSAQEAHDLGRAMQVHCDWPACRIAAMERVLRAKFADPALRAALVATGTQYLEAGNDWGDTFWGVYQGQGLNHLGHLLMRLRDEFR